MIELKYFLAPATNAIYEMTEGASIEGIELIEISFEEHSRRLAEQQKKAASQRRQLIESANRRAQELADLIAQARIELAAIGLSAATIDLILPPPPAQDSTPAQDDAPAEDSAPAEDVAPAPKAKRKRI